MTDDHHPKAMTDFPEILPAVSPVADALSPEHRNHFLAEIGPEGLAIALRMGARSIDADEAHRLGFRFKGWRGGGILMPFGDDFAQLRCDDPPLDSKGDPVKYLSPVGVRPCAVTIGDGEPTAATEGWKDAIALHLLTGEATQGIAGVHFHGGLAPSVARLIYDADAAINPDVWAPLIAAGLERPKLRLSFWPRDIAGDKGGACEFLRAGGDPSTVRRFKARELIRSLPGQWDRTLRVDWKDAALHRLAGVAIDAGFSRDAVEQLVTEAAKGIDFRIPAARRLIARARRKRTPPPAAIEGIIRDDAPPERQAAERVFLEQKGLVACSSERLYRYDPERGYWPTWSDADAETAALDVLARMADMDPETGRPRYSYGTDREMRAAVNLLARIAGPGPIPDEPPPVIVFGNGTYNLHTEQLGPHDPEHGATYAVDADHAEGADCPAELRRVIETCYPEGAEPIIRAWLRWITDPTIPYGHCFHFIGDTGTGKGVLIEFGGSLVPLSLQASLPHPSAIDSVDKLHQLVRGRRLVLFPDAPARPRGAGHCGLFYELVENKPQTTRRLHSSNTEDARSMFARCVIGSVAPLQFGEARDGFQRRVLTLLTLPRNGEPDPTLRDNLIGSSSKHRAIRSQAISWALSMPLDEVMAVLSKNDPEGLLRQGDAAIAAAGDTVSQFVDACLIPHPKGPQAEVDDSALSQMFEAYIGWCRYAGVQHSMQHHNFMGQLRRVLGPRRCLPRRKESMAEVRARGGTDKAERLNLERLEAGFALRPGVLQPGIGEVHGDRSTFNRRAIGSGGLEAIAGLEPALRPPTDSPETPPTDSPETPLHAGGKPGSPPNGADEQPPDDPSTALRHGGVSQGVSQGWPGGVSGLDPLPRSTASTAESANQEGVSQGSPSTSRLKERKTPEAPREGGESFFSTEGKKNAESPETPPPALRRDNPVEVLQPDGSWHNGYRFVTRVADKRAQVTGPGGTRVVPLEQIRRCAA